MKTLEPPIIVIDGDPEPNSAVAPIAADAMIDALTLPAYGGKTASGAAATAANPARAAVRTPPVGLGWVGGCLLAIASVYFLREAQALLVPVAVAVVLTLVLSTPVRYLARRGVPEFIGAGILVTALIAAVALVGNTLVVPASEWWDRAPASVEQLIKQVERVRASIGIPAPPAPTPAPASVAPARKTAVSQADPAPAAPAPPPQDPVKEKIVTESVALTGIVIGRVFAFGISTVATLILLYFLLASEHWLVSRTIEAIERRRTRALFLSGVRRAQYDIGRFISALSMINFGVGLITIALMSYIGLPNPVLWGTLAGILNFIPYIGPIIVVGMLLLASVVSFVDQPALIIAPSAAFMAVHAIESNFVTPWFVGRQLALSRLSVFLSVMFWGWLWGMAGALLAVPVLIAVRSACKRMPRMRRLCVYLDEHRERPPSLRSLLGGRGRARGGRLRPAAGVHKSEKTEPV